MRYAIVNLNNFVVSIVVWPNGNFEAPRDHKVIQSDIAQPGWKYNPGTGLFVPPVKL